ncbi:MAG: YciI family protein, partial [Actinomycetota bacterium]
AETKEQLGGYYVIECDNLDQAIEAAERLPGALYGTVEVRPVLVFDQG